MRSRFLIFAALCSTPVAFAQQATTVQLECHELSSTGNVLGPDETLMNGMACHTVKQAPVKQAQSQIPQVVAASEKSYVATPAPATVPASNAQPAPVAPATADSLKIIQGSRVYITPMDGFENYLAAAFGKKKVPLIPVADQNQADYVISGTSIDKKAGWAKIVFMGNIHSDNAASVTMTDRRTGAIVYAYAVDKKSTMHGQQTTAEACAKHLKAHIEGHE
jgi:hypothetical protein